MEGQNNASSEQTKSDLCILDLPDTALRRILSMLSLPNMHSFARQHRRLQQCLMTNYSYCLSGQIWLVAKPYLHPMAQYSSKLGANQWRAIYERCSTFDLDADIVPVVKSLESSNLVPVGAKSRIVVEGNHLCVVYREQGPNEGYADSGILKFRQFTYSQLRRPIGPGPITDQTWNLKAEWTYETCGSNGRTHVATADILHCPLMVITDKNGDASSIVASFVDQRNRGLFLIRFDTQKNGSEFWRSDIFGCWARGDRPPEMLTMHICNDTLYAVLIWHNPSRNNSFRVHSWDYSTGDERNLGFQATIRLGTRVVSGTFWCRGSNCCDLVLCSRRELKDDPFNIIVIPLAAPLWVYSFNSNANRLEDRTRRNAGVLENAFMERQRQGIILPDCRYQLDDIYFDPGPPVFAYHDSIHTGPVLPLINMFNKQLMFLQKATINSTNPSEGIDGSLITAYGPYKDWFAECTGFILANYASGARFIALMFHSADEARTKFTDLYYYGNVTRPPRRIRRLLTFGLLPGPMGSLMGLLNGFDPAGILYLCQELTKTEHDESSSDGAKYLIACIKI